MFTSLIEFLGSIVIFLISTFGYLGVFIAMTVESACIPLPSEIIMPFSGYLVHAGNFNIWLVTLAGASGNLLGSLLAYWAGYYGGRPFVEKYGKYFMVTRHDVEMADRWFERHGDATAFFSRMLPIIRTFISLPAGIARMNIWKFSVFTFIGSIPWCYGLAFVGVKLGENWNTIGDYFHKADMAIGALIVVALFVFVRRHIGR